MENIRKLAHGQKALMTLLTDAWRSVWSVHRTPGGHVKLTKPCCRPVYTSSTSGDHRAVRNARALLRRLGGNCDGKFITHRVFATVPLALCVEKRGWVSGQPTSLLRYQTSPLSLSR